VTPPVGEGNHDKNRDYTIDELVRRRCVIQIKNNDKFCLARALVVAMNRYDKDMDPARWERIRFGETKRYTDQFKEAKLLMEKAGLENHDGHCGIPELKALQDILPDCQIKVFSSDLGHKIMFEGKQFLLHINILCDIISLFRKTSKSNAHSIPS